MLHRNHILGLALGLALVFGTGNRARLDAQENVNLGVKAGINFADLGGSDVSSEAVQGKTGLVGGLSVAFRFGDIFEVQGEFLYSQKGVKIEETGANGLTNGTISLNYMETPILLKAGLPTQGKFRPALYAGPAVSFEMSCDLSGTFDGETADRKCDNQDDGWVPKERKTFDWGLVFGAEAVYKVGRKTSLLFEVRYNLGLSSLEATEQNLNVKNRALSLMAGVLFAL
jgi:hypothetical protein